MIFMDIPLPDKIELAQVELTQDRLKTFVSYDPITGVFSRLKAYGNKPVGSAMGGPDSYGYTQIFVDGRLRLGHRLAFLYMLGRLPIEEVDHIDGIVSNNKWDNLRECNRSQNLRNTSVAKHSSTGVKGVSWHKASGKYRARVFTTVGGKPKRLELGGFDTILEASNARNAAAKQHHGEFYHE